ncbi:unnamed protein product [Prunus armeniaca]|uniref:glycerophosphodiester phosphodiesterase n=1 Tax=Prunus armeniaca TaxID=36596 RepID=A0A6J5VM82_PRUAR|nr:unnamed protein product [Prunus armeniaca]
MAISTRLGRRLSLQQRQQRFGFGAFLFRFSSKRVFRAILISLAFIAFVPPIFFFFKLKRFHQTQLRKCGWLNEPPLVCAHGGDSSKAFPNTTALRLTFLVLWMEFCLRSMTGRDLQRLTGNNASKVGYLSVKEIKDLGSVHQSARKFPDENVPTIEEALEVISSSVRRVILDIKVGPPSYEKGLASDVLSVVKRMQCKNCLVWAKSDNLARDVIKLSSDIMVGYIVMIDPSTRARTNLLRMKGAGVVGVYHPLIDETLVRILHGRKKEVYAWTVDDMDSMQEMLYEHVDAIVTSNPTMLQGLMQISEHSVWSTISGH